MPARLGERHGESRGTLELSRVFGGVLGTRMKSGHQLSGTGSGSTTTTAPPLGSGEGNREQGGAGVGGEKRTHKCVQLSRRVGNNTV